MSQNVSQMKEVTVTVYWQGFSDKWTDGWISCGLTKTVLAGL